MSGGPRPANRIRRREGVPVEGCDGQDEARAGNKRRLPLSRNFGSLGPAHEGQSDCCSQQTMGSALVSVVAVTRALSAGSPLGRVPRRDLGTAVAVLARSGSEDLPRCGPALSSPATRPHRRGLGLVWPAFRAVAFADVMSARDSWLCAYGENPGRRRHGRRIRNRTIRSLRSEDRGRPLDGPGGVPRHGHRMAPQL